MRMGILVNDVATEEARYSTTALARSARGRGHPVWVMGSGDFVYERGHLCAWARKAPEPGESASAFLQQLRAKGRLERITVDDLDVLLLRNNPFDDLHERPWAAHVGLVFGEEAQRHGVLVLNDPAGLSHALSKLYLERFPAAMRPASLITRRAEDVRAFADEHQPAVVKPLHGSGGRGVFILRAEDTDNFHQILEAVSAYGYLIVQEYLPQAREGDVRLLLLNGRPLEVDGKFAAMRRCSANGDLRNNVSSGAHVAAVEVDGTMLSLAELARPRLVEDGMWFVGLDVVGDKVMEVNVFSPGGLVGTSRLAGVDFSAHVIEDLERKVAYTRRGRFDNRVLACM